MNTTFEGLKQSGKYDDLAAMICKEVNARAVLLTVIDGCMGHGMTMACTEPKLRMVMPSLLRRMADILEQEQKIAENQ